MEDRGKNPGTAADEGNPDEKRRDQGGFQETPAQQGLKSPPFIPPGEDSGEWTRGGGADPNAIVKRRGDPPR